jgi:hypothetical protein
MVLAIIGAILFGACGQNKQPLATPPVIYPIKYFVSGIYTAFEQSRFCRSWDTLIISRDKYKRNVHLISRKTAYQRNQGDNYFPVEKTVAYWSGVYNQGGHIITGLVKDLDLAVMPTVNALRLDDITYEKIE